MAYIGKQPSTKFSAAAKVDTFTGDGSTVAFDLANTVPAGGENGLQIYVNNVRQKPGASNAYTLGNDGSGDLKRITFTEAPEASAEIYVITTYEATNIKNVPDGTITNEKIADGAIDNAAVSPSAAISDTKLGTISTACKVATTAISQPGSSSVYLAGDGNWGAIDTTQQDTNAFNISLLGFKMAVNEGLTVFNLVDGVVDEFNDESGTDEAEGSNDSYCGIDDYYINGAPFCLSAGFTTTSITEPDTSTTGTNPAYSSGTFGVYTVPSGVTSVTAFTWGAGGGSAQRPVAAQNGVGGGGGFSTSTTAVTPGQSLTIVVGEGGDGGAPSPSPASDKSLGGGGGSADDIGCGYAGGGGLSGIFNGCVSTTENSDETACASAPQVYLIAAGGAGGAYQNADIPGEGTGGGAGGGLTGYVGGNTNFGATQTGSEKNAGGGGDQEQGGQGGGSGVLGQWWIFIRR